MKQRKIKIFQQAKIGGICTALWGIYFPCYDATIYICSLSNLHSMAARSAGLAERPFRFADDV